MSLFGRCATLTRAALVLACAAFLLPSPAIDISSRYRSPRNPERKVRDSTQLIVLHTTEAPARSSLNKLSERGEAHFCVTEEGAVYAIVDRDREAFHAGRSMWNGREDVDKFSLGIECVGYHDKPMSSVQLTAIRDLVKYLQGMYRIPDERVVCHSHVAYGTPNKWQKFRHRGRKRCGMLFAMPSVRRILALKTRPAFDADVRKGRLTVGDPYLQGVLYGRTDTMVGKCGRAPAASSSSVGSWFASMLGKKPQPEPEPTVKAAPKLPPKSIAQLKARGFVNKGTVTKKVSASKIAGGKWNAPDTFYTIRDKVIPGNAIDEGRIEKGMCVWMRK